VLKTQICVTRPLFVNRSYWEIFCGLIKIWIHLGGTEGDQTAICSDSQEVLGILWNTNFHDNSSANEAVWGNSLRRSAGTVSDMSYIFLWSSSSNCCCIIDKWSPGSGSTVFWITKAAFGRKHIYSTLARLSAVSIPQNIPMETREFTFGISVAVIRSLMFSNRLRNIWRWITIVDVPW